MLGSFLALAGFMFWFVVIILVLVFKRLKTDPTMALHWVTLARRFFGR